MPEGARKRLASGAACRDVSGNARRFATDAETDCVCLDPNVCPALFTKTFCTNLGGSWLQHPPLSIFATYSITAAQTACQQIEDGIWIKLTSIPTSGSVCMTSLTNNGALLGFAHRGDFSAGSYGGMYYDSGCVTLIEALTKIQGVFTQDPTDLTYSVIVVSNTSSTFGGDNIRLVRATASVASPHDCTSDRTIANNNTTAFVPWTAPGSFPYFGYGGEATSNACCEVGI